MGAEEKKCLVGANDLTDFIDFVFGTGIGSALPSIVIPELADRFSVPLAAEPVVARSRTKGCEVSVPKPSVDFRNTLVQPL
jgi:hypothetical protein